MEPVPSGIRSALTSNPATKTSCTAASNWKRWAVPVSITARVRAGRTHPTRPGDCTSTLIMKAGSLRLASFIGRRAGFGGEHRRPTGPHHRPDAHFRRGRRGQVSRQTSAAGREFAAARAKRNPRAADIVFRARRQPGGSTRAIGNSSPSAMNLGNYTTSPTTAANFKTSPRKNRNGFKNSQTNGTSGPRKISSPRSPKTTAWTTCGVRARIEETEVLTQKEDAKNAKKSFGRGFQRES